MMQKGEAPTKRRRKETTWCQTPLAIILGICWRFLSIGADLTLVIASGPSSRTNSTHPNSGRGGLVAACQVFPALATSSTAPRLERYESCHMNWFRFFFNNWLLFQFGLFTIDQPLSWIALIVRGLYLYIQMITSLLHLETESRSRRPINRLILWMSIIFFAYQLFKANG